MTMDRPAGNPATLPRRRRSAGTICPPGILAAIGRVESGRADAAGHVGPWPWTIDAAGAGAWLPSGAAAVAAVAALQRQGQRIIDVGCFQVNLQHHPRRLCHAGGAFDPQTTRTTPPASWRRCTTAPAAGRTRSRLITRPNQPRGAAYRALVFAQWASTAPPLDDPPAAPPGGEVVIAGVHILTPMVAGSAPHD